MNDRTDPTTRTHDRAALLAALRSHLGLAVPIRPALPRDDWAARAGEELLRIMEAR